VEPEELIDLGDRVVLLATGRGRAEASGVPVMTKVATVWVLNHGRVIRLQAYFDHADALEAAGLSEQAMSQENMKVVRRPLRVRERSSRPLDQRVSLRFPRLVDPYIRVIERLPPSSRIRQAAVARVARLTLEAWNRRDLDAFHLGRAPDWEFRPARELVEAGLTEECYRGPAGYRDFLARFFEAWGADARAGAVELVDLGDRLVVLGHVATRGRASDVPVTHEYAWVARLSDGKVSHQQEYLDHAEALEAVRLRE
jgi:ketosteroid isomerase-like protein